MLIRRKEKTTARLASVTRRPATKKALRRSMRRAARAPTMPSTMKRLTISKE